MLQSLDMLLHDVADVKVAVYVAEVVNGTVAGYVAA